MGRFFSSNRNIRIFIAGVFVVWCMCVGVMVIGGLVITRNSRAGGVATQVANPVTEANIQVSPAEGYAGTELTVSGANWRPGEVVFIRLQSTAGDSNENYAYAGAVADEKGQFASTFTYPYDTRWLEGDAVQVMARAEASGVQATVPFRLAQPTVVPTPTEMPLPTDTPIPTEEPVAPGMPTPTPRPLPPLPPPPAVPAITDWRGDYFNSANLQGQPVLIRNDQQINFDWAMGSPDPAVRMDNFSVRWTRNQGFDAGNYRFLIKADDGARFYVDDQLVIDQWHDGPTMYAVDLSLAQGGHNLRLEYFEHGGWALAQLSWQRVETSYPDWKGEYFNNANLSGTPAFVRNDPWVDFNWGTGSPAPNIQPDNFAARWTRRLHFDEGDYRFSVRVDDGARLWVDDQLVIDQWHDSGVTSYVADLHLSSADHNVRLEYYDRAGGAEAHLWWERSEAASYPDWKGEYFSNRKLQNSPAMVRNDPDIDFSWGSKGPGGGVAADGFSVRWTRTIRFDSSTTYVFHGRMDDGLRLWVDDNQVIDAWSDGSVRDVSGTAKVSKGNHAVRVEYYNRGSGAEINVDWEKQAAATATSVTQPTNTPVAPPAGSPTATSAPQPVETTQPLQQTLDLAPAQGPVNSPVTVRGANWPAGLTVSLTLAQPQPNAKTLQVNPNLNVGQATVDASGNFEVQVVVPAGQGWESMPQVLVVAYTPDLSKTAVVGFAITGAQPQPTAVPPTEQPAEATAVPPTEQPAEATAVPPTEQPVEATAVPPTGESVTATPVEPTATPEPTNTPKPKATDTAEPAPTDTPTTVEEPTAAPEPLISVAPISGTLGITLTVTGQNWPAGVEVGLGLAKPPADPSLLATVPVTATTVQVGEKGKFAAQIWLPAGPEWDTVPEALVVARSADNEHQAVVPYTVIAVPPQAPTP